MNARKQFVIRVQKADVGQ